LGVIARVSKIIRRRENGNKRDQMQGIPKWQLLF
jgi:hypothetical protein